MLSTDFTQFLLFLLVVSIMFHLNMHNGTSWLCGDLQFYMQVAMMVTGYPVLAHVCTVLKGIKHIPVGIAFPVFFPQLLDKSQILEEHLSYSDWTFENSRWDTLFQ